MHKKIHPHLYALLIPIHILFVFLFFYIDYQVVHFLFLVFLLWVLIGGIGLEIFFHRIISHKQFHVTKNVERFWALIGCLSLNGSPTFWRAMHVGYHHPYSDSHKDFHTSKFKGKLWSYLLYVNSLWKVKYVGCREYIEDHYYRFLNYFYIPLVWLTIGTTLFFSPFFALCTLGAMVLSYHQTAIVNTFCHNTKLGYSTHETNDGSRNVPYLTWITFGQSLHNNHHKYPQNANNACIPGETDVGFFLAKLIGLKPPIVKK